MIAEILLGLCLIGQNPPYPVTYNDYSVNNKPIEVKIIDPPQNGKIIFSLNGEFDYTPNTDFVGTDSFTYCAIDQYWEYEDKYENVAKVDIVVENTLPIEIDGYLYNKASSPNSQIPDTNIDLDLKVNSGIRTYVNFIDKNGYNAFSTITDENGEINNIQKIKGQYTIRVVKEGFLIHKVYMDIQTSSSIQIELTPNNNTTYVPLANNDRYFTLKNDPLIVRGNGPKLPELPRGLWSTRGISDSVLIEVINNVENE